ncbi:hypothetical protein M3Y95_01273200 [Aphelenchoides besseyi]|nr:hypothetical protein M3Y95_01273200 [Aphelenchoides besseyi]
MFEREEVHFVSEEFFHVFSLVQTILLVPSIVIYGLLVWVVTHHSPRRIGNYKWYILVSSTFGFIFTMASNLFRPYLLFPYPIMVIPSVDVLLKFMDIPQWLINVLLNIFFLNVLAFGYSITCMFFFRFLQTTRSPYLYLASNMKLYFISYLIVGSIAIISVMLPMNLSAVSNRELHEQMRLVDPIAYTRMEGHICVGIDYSINKFYILAIFDVCLLLCICTVVILFSAYKCLRVLMSNHHFLSPKTLSLYRTLLNMLFIEVVGAAFTSWGLGITALLLLLLRVPVSGPLITIGLLCADCYPFFVHLLVLCYVEPYRLAAYRLLRLEKLRRTQQTLAIEKSTDFTNLFRRISVRPTPRNQEQAKY